MVHNGIEYGVMQLIAETYDLMKRGWGLNDDEVHEVYASWNKDELNGYLVEITSHIFSKPDERTGQRLDRRNPRRGQTGRHRHVDLTKRDGTANCPIPTIDLAVAMRDLSAFEKEREQAGANLSVLRAAFQR